MTESVTGKATVCVRVRVIDFLDKNFTVPEVAEVFNVTESTVRTWLKTDEIRGIKLPGGQWRIPGQAFKEFAMKVYKLTEDEMIQDDRA